MIPAWTSSGVLPPYLGSDPTSNAMMSPFEVSASELVQHYATSDARKVLLRGWLEYRADLKAVGVADGFQWIDGSFVEDCEVVRGRPPDDIDLVTFAPAPPGVVDQTTFLKFIAVNSHLLNPDQAKSKYHCHAFYVALNLHPALIVDATKFYFGLFSHQRVTAIWKGMLKVPLLSDDSTALALLK